jgi:hypothetical protein
MAVSVRAKLPPQVSRLLLLTVVIVLLFLGARALLVPVSFGQYGWYRGNALQEIASSPIAFAGRAACEGCHEDVTKHKAGGKHKGLSCEACHGSNAAHAEDPNTATSKIENPRFCLQCHAKDFSKPEKFPQVDAREHAGKDACRTCHKAHTPSEAPEK